MHDEMTGKLDEFKSTILTNTDRLVRLEDKVEINSISI